MGPTRAAGAAAPTPRLSVVVPFHDVADYLDDTLRSIADQTVADFEVVLVDDGSTDGSAAIALAWVERDPRFRCVRQDNAGPGGARNTGIALTSGEYLAFVDGDDLVTHQGFERLIASLERTGSDVAAGGVRRVSGRHTRPSPLHTETFATDRAATHVSRDRLLLRDRTVWNKVYRRSFWDASGLAFPEGMTFEDMPVALGAHVLAGSVDVLSTTVYEWRERHAGAPSISQRRGDVQHFRNRMEAVRMVRETFALHGTPELRRWYDETVLTNDLDVPTGVLETADAAFRTAYVELVGALLRDVDPDVVASLPAIRRLEMHLVSRGLVDELVQAVGFARAELARTPNVRVRGRWYGDYPYRTDPALAVPAEVYALDDELRLRTDVDGLRWDADELVVTGYAFVDGVPCPTTRAQRLRVTLVDPATGATLARLRARKQPRPDVTARVGSVATCYDGTGFEVRVPAGALRRDGTWVRGRLDLRVEVRCGGVTREGAVTGPSRGPAERLPAVLVGDRVVAPLGATGKPFGVSAVRSGAVVTDASCDAGTLTLSGTAPAPGEADAEPLALVAERTNGEGSLTVEATRSPDDPTVWTSLVDVAALRGALGTAAADRAESSGDGVVWGLWLAAGEQRTRVRLDPDAPHRAFVTGPTEVTVHRARNGTANLHQRSVRPVVDDVRWDDGRVLHLAGSFPAPDRDDRVLVVASRSQRTERVVPVRRDGDRFVAELDPSALDGLAGRTPLRAGQWELLLRGPGGAGTEVALKVRHDLLDRAPFAAARGPKEYEATTRGLDRLVLVVTDDLAVDERGPYRQRVLRTETYPRLSRRRLSGEVVVESSGGRAFADSPRAIVEELRRRGDPRRVRWAVADGEAVLPPGVEPLRRGSRDWYEALARARWVVTNDHLPAWFARRPDQVVVQTWHGTPVKQVGRARPDLRYVAGDGVRQVEGAAANWSHVVTASPFATSVMRSSFGYEGTVLETGLPRNDVLHAGDRDDAARAVRERLGLPAGKRVVLVAPSWRDDRRFARGRFALDLRLDLDAARDALADDTVLLVRYPRQVADVVPPDPTGFVVDVTAVPDAADVLLVADVLVTDYSSLMVDLAPTSRPILLLVPDLATVRDELSGLTLDLEECAPGPLLSTSAEVVAALADPDAAVAGVAGRRAAFVRDLCPHDDGGAAARVVDALQG